MITCPISVRIEDSMDFSPLMITFIFTGFCTNLADKIVSADWDLFSYLLNRSSSKPRSVKQQLIFVLDPVSTLSWIIYCLVSDPVAWIRLGTISSGGIIQLISLITFIYCCYWRSHGCGLALHTRVVTVIIPTSILILLAVSLLYKYDAVEGTCFGIVAAIISTLSSFLSLLQLWDEPGDWKILPRSILASSNGGIRLFMAKMRQDVVFMVGSMLVIAFGLGQLGFSLYVHKIRNIPWFSQSQENPHPLPNQSVAAKEPRVEMAETA